MQMVKFGKCSLCDKPGVGAVNINANAAATSPAVWEVRCDEHNPYWNPTASTIPSWLSKVLEVANDPRFSDEFVGNVLRYHSKRESSD